ncbi:MAG: DUF1349 domain-containing protein [Proteobacteria bacterium]|jgi:regulation of enolase protein 1 (concanavalin A-like superfamily)|nr:DUF1349 domain-containing protein [Pseudomonadota bacterium]
MSYLINGAIDESFTWLNEPVHTIGNDFLSITTNPDTDFWQKTHYGFERDNGHCLLRKIDFDFSMQTRTTFEPKSQYDQCGLIVRINAENWIKTSTEYESKTHSRLGSVVTNLGYSDWATIDINGQTREMHYRIQSKNNLTDYLIEYSNDGFDWKQLRIAHLHSTAKEVQVGIYACSPMQTSFEGSFHDFSISSTFWK